MITVTILLIHGPCDYTDREVITESLIDAICDVHPTKIITNDEYGFNDVVAELLFHTSIEYERHCILKNKYGSSAISRCLNAMCMESSHALIFGEISTELNYFITRYNLTTMITTLLYNYTTY